MSSPANRMVPPLGRFSPTMARASVVLPEPLSPTIPTVSPSETLRSTPSSARKTLPPAKKPARAGNATVRFSTFRSGSGGAEPTPLMLGCRRPGWESMRSRV
jgi:hypothetical protein